MSGVGGEHGCGSTACIFDAPSVGVPSPCACLDDTPRETRVRVRKAVYKRKGVVARLRAEVERLTADLLGSAASSGETMAKLDAHKREVDRLRDRLAVLEGGTVDDTDDGTPGGEQ